ncbi:uncharacterized protein LOC126355128 isoform X2 [Schistocerca gregaria]|uniref:uncharacterized protein LOC126355128 isoform X2 n=1 Tax=Schistocerca gregaria TaxID=7010 RepID=UPI00211E82F2|nr:uncharacterized protein LOC126355128 isoform X2 [Schistocerca gregaria]
MAYYRRNTLRCEFAGGADRPTEREVHRWVRTQLRVPDKELKALQLHTQHAVAFLKLRSDAAFLQLAERLCGGGGGAAALQLQSGKLTPVRVSVADDDGGVEVRVFDVPLEVPDAEFRRALAPYGKWVALTGAPRAARGVCARLRVPRGDGRALPAAGAARRRRPRLGAAAAAAGDAGDRRAPGGAAAEPRGVVVRHVEPRGRRVPRLRRRVAAAAAAPLPPRRGAGARLPGAQRRVAAAR